MLSAETGVEEGEDDADGRSVAARDATDTADVDDVDEELVEIEDGAVELDEDEYDVVSEVMMLVVSTMVDVTVVGDAERDDEDVEDVEDDEEKYEAV